MDMDIKQVIVMRTDLNMRKGKMIAQGAHAAMMFISKRFSQKPGGELIGDDYSIGEVLEFRPSDNEFLWLRGNFKKICLGVGSEEELLNLHQAANDAHLGSHLCTDNGLTEFGGVPTNTCIAIGPDEASKIDAITGHLKLL